jgi:anti-anti-sigma factor
MIPSPTARPSSPGFGCRRHDIGAGVVRLALTGELDAAGAVALDQVLRSALADGAVAVIDLDELTSIDATAAGVLRAGASQARGQGRRMVAVNARPAVERKLQRLGIARELKLVETPPIPVSVCSP